MIPRVCIHGHFYQPPRENPWLGDVEIQDSAYPYHDWNARITAECYAPNSAARILEGGKEIVKIVNNYARISFNFGPTLFSWLEKQEPEVYRSILEADRQSLERFSGHGSAIAQAYSHLIMPLASSRDKRTQVIWGIQDFKHRFRRNPEGMWLPETAVDLETLEIMAVNGIRFTILAPQQARRVRKIGEREWIDVTGGKIDPKQPYVVHLPSGEKMAVFFYDGNIAHDIAFGDLLKNGERFSQRLLRSFSLERKELQIIHAATDGESYGHHHRFGEMALAYCLDEIESGGRASLTVYGEFLDMCDPGYEVEIGENTSWSCVHGVERWRSDCGCNTGLHPDWKQTWRAALRDGMDWLRNQVCPIYEKESRAFLQEPWDARNDYIQVILDRAQKNVESYLSRHSIGRLGETEKKKILMLLEMERNAMLMFTSCGWFFDDITGIETVQIMRYAGRVIQLARAITGKNLEPGFLQRIGKAPSNQKTLVNGAAVYEKFVRPAVLDPQKIGVHYAVSSLFEDGSENARIGDFTVQGLAVDHEESGSNKIRTGQAMIRSDVTWEEEAVFYAVLFWGEQNLRGGAARLSDQRTYSSMLHDMKKAFQKEDPWLVIRLMDHYFEGHIVSLWSLPDDKKREILNRILKKTLTEAEASLRQIFENHYFIMSALRENSIPLPKAFLSSMEFILDADFRRAMEEDDPDLDNLQKIVLEFKKWDFSPDRILFRYICSSRLNKMMARLRSDPVNIVVIRKIDSLLTAWRDLRVDLDLWKSQNIYFSLCNELRDDMEKKRRKGDPLAEEWMKSMGDIGRLLQVKCW